MHAGFVVITFESMRTAWAWTLREHARIKRMILIALLGFIVSILVCIGEVVWERDWPRETWKYAALWVLVMVAAAGA